VASWKGQSRGNVLGYKIFITVLKISGLPLAYFMMRFVAFYFFLAVPSSFKNTYDFYRNKLKFSFLSSVLAVYRNYHVFGQVILDKTATMAGFPTRFSFNFDGEHHLRKIAADKSGGLLISAHIGNFEMAGHMLKRLETRINIIMLDAEHEKVKNYLSSFIQKSYHIITLSDDNSHIYEIRQALENKEILCIHGDRFMKNSKVIQCDFLGEKASFPTGPFYLAMKYSVPVSFVFAMKEGNKDYHFFATAPKYYCQQANQKKRDEILRQIIEDFIAELEIKIRQYPYQWFNYYNFWEK
jgi:predicted LPLAT superfamily acyltransferase